MSIEHLSLAGFVRFYDELKNSFRCEGWCPIPPNYPFDFFTFDRFLYQAGVFRRRKFPHQNILSKKPNIHYVEYGPDGMEYHGSRSDISPRYIRQKVNMKAKVETYMKETREGALGRVAKKKTQKYNQFPHLWTLPLEVLEMIANNFDPREFRRFASVFPVRVDRARLETLQTRQAAEVTLMFKHDQRDLDIFLYLLSKKQILAKNMKICGVFMTIPNSDTLFTIENFCLSRLFCCWPYYYLDDESREVYLSQHHTYSDYVEYSDPDELELRTDGPLYKVIWGNPRVQMSYTKSLFAFGFNDSKFVLLHWQGNDLVYDSYLLTGTCDPTVEYYLGFGSEGTICPYIYNDFLISCSNIPEKGITRWSICDNCKLPMFDDHEYCSAGAELDYRIFQIL